MKKRGLLLLFILFMGYGIMNVRAEETYTGEFRKISTDGNWTVTANMPDDEMGADAILEYLADTLIDTEEYYVTVDFEDFDTFGLNKVIVYVSDWEDYEEEHILNMTYIEPPKVAEVEAIMNKIKEYEDTEIAANAYANTYNTTVYTLDDLNLINYLYFGSFAFSDPSIAFNFSKELIEDINGSNIEFLFDSSFDNFWADTELYLGDFGDYVLIMYKGIPYGAKWVGLAESHVLYIPNDTADNTESYITAIKKRIKDYLGIDVTVTVGDTLESVEYDDYEDYSFIGSGLAPSNNDDAGRYYYDITINDETYSFAIGKSNNLQTPKYFGSDIENNISITSESSLIPLDTALSVEKVTNNTIKEALGTTDYVAYDIELFSNAADSEITTLNDGTFEVKIPVPSFLNGKEIAVYYISSTGEKTKHVSTVSNGFVTFTTNHFSTYALVEDVTVEPGNPNTPEVPENPDTPEVPENPDTPEVPENPDTPEVPGNQDTPQTPEVISTDNPGTGDNVIMSIVLGFVSLVGLTGAVFYTRKRFN